MCGVAVPTECIVQGLLQARKIGLETSSCSQTWGIVDFEIRNLEQSGQYAPAVSSVICVCLEVATFEQI